MKTPTTHPRSTNKVRRDALGGKRGDGHRRYQRIRRPDPRNIHIGAPDSGLTAYGGLAGFGAFIRELGVDESLRYRFGRLKSGVMVVYPMQTQMRLLMDAAAVGEARVFAVESLSADPVPVHVERIALSGEQVAKWRLPTHGLKKTDNRAKRFRREHGHEACELEAVPPNQLRALVSKSITRHVDPRKIDAAKANEELEREALKLLPEFVRRWHGG